MKVIQNNDTIEVTCPGCKSVLGVGVDDIRYIEMAHHGSQFQSSCVLCGHNLDISSGKVPRRWYALLGVED